LKLEVLQPLSVPQRLLPGQRDQPADLRQMLQQALFFLWRRWKFVLLVTALALLGAEAWLAAQTPLYSASTQIIFDPTNEKLASGDSSSEATLDSLTLDNQIAIVKSTALLRRVVEKERLFDDPEFGSKPIQTTTWLGDMGPYFERATQAVHPYLAYFARTFKNSSIDVPARAVGIYLKHFAEGIDTVFSRPIKTAEAPPVPGVEEKGEPTKSAADDADASDRVGASVAALARAVTAKRVGEADVISVSVTSADPVRAARLANAVAEAYLVDPLYARLDAGLRESAWLNQRLPELRDRLRESEEAVVAFRAEHNLVDGGQNVTLNQDQMAQLNARLVAARADVAEKKAKVDLLERLEARGGDADGLPETMNSGLLASLRTQLGENSLRVAGLAARLGDGNPEVIKARAERADIKRAITAELQAVAQNVRNQYSLASAQEDSIEKILHDAAGETNLASKTAIQLRELEEEASVNRHLFEDFLKRISAIHGLSGDQARVGRVLVAATPPDVTSFPRNGLIWGAALFAGLTLGLGGAWAREQLSPGFITSREAEEELGLPLLVSIGRTDVRGTRLALPRHVRLNPLSRLSEAVRTLRTSIQMSEFDQPPKVVQVTSSLPGEGKTTTSLMLAASFSESGLKTLIIDADLRNPSVSRYFALDKELGVVDLLLNQANAESIVRFNEAHGLWVLPAGVNSKGSGDLLSFDRVRNLIERYRATYDCIVIDGPPIGQVVDARVIANLVDKVIFVVKWSATNRELVRENIRLIPDRGKIAGVVFNFVDERLAKRYGDSRYFSY
jgi:succinoglycan biosynthesis transport protein ExoP